MMANWLGIHFLAFWMSSNAFAFTPAEFSLIVPYQDEIRLRCANYSDFSWQVSSDQSGKIDIAPAPRKRSLEAKLQTHGGELLGTNHGEWGGKLLWKKDNTETELINENVSFIFEEGDTVLIFGGLDHLVSMRGFVARLKWDGAKFTVDKKISIDFAPYAVMRLAENKYLIADMGGLKLFENEKTSRLKHAKLGQLYPGSIAMDADENIYVGMRFAVAKFTKANAYEYRWLVKEKCVNVKGLESVYENVKSATRKKAK